MTSTDAASQNQKLLLIDGHSLAFRSFYGTPVDVFVNSQGQHTNAVHGFLSTLLSLIKSEKPSHIVAAFDLAGGTFRTEEYGEYKGGRAETPQEFLGQVELIQRLLEQLNIPSVTVERFEADDIVATLAKIGQQEGMEVEIVSGDRDAFQLVNDTVTVLYPVTTGPSKGIRRMDPAAVEEKYKIPPHLYPDLAAITGEQADNLPGVPGVGPGFAAKWINEYGNLDGIIENKEKIKGKKGEALREHLDDVLRNRRLNRLVDDLELPITLADAAEFGPRDPETLNELFDELEFRSIRQRLAEVFSDLAQAAAARIDISVESVQTIESAQEFSDFVEGALAAITAAERPVAVPERLARALVLYPVVDEDAAEAGNAHEQNLTGAVLLGGARAGWIKFAEIDAATEKALSDWLADENQKKIVFDTKLNVKSLAARGFRLAGVVEDPVLSSYVCGHVPSARRRFFEAMMEDLTDAYLRTEFPKAEVKESAQGELFSLEAEVDLEYVALVARYIQELAYALHADLAEQNQLKLYEEIELPLATVLAQMERAGIAVDSTVLAELKDHYNTFIKQATEEAYRLIDHEVNLGSPKQLQAVLFEELELPTTRKLKSGYSTDAESMADLLTRIDPDSKGAQFLLALQMYRDYTKLKQTVEGLQKATAEDGRIHTTFQQNVAATGRLSSTDPNLQNIPIRTEEGRKIRGAFVVDPRTVDGQQYSTLLTADYSQIEMRIMVHLAQDEKLIEAYESGEDLHRFVGSEVFGVAPEDVTPEMRAKVKAMSYGLAYGLSRFGLSKQLGIPVEEAAQLTVNYFKRFGDVGRFLRGTLKEAHQDGYTETMFGRRRNLPDLGSSNRARREAAERAALNAPIQGSAADIMKIAMINVAARLEAEGLKTRMLLQIHDELILEVAPGEEEAAAAVLSEEMSRAVELRVPLDVQVGSGTSWHEAGH
ncbi:DNA polymerase I [Rothia aerolata]|uniref:DNA polymerase I n=1 Tax=Rothia aerolata TaxID=1812262 RepID=A0A917IMM8_9MICC|nr:DNA polymerase I [Rothia aerolata]GGH57053.1 DNA polymerase I [Rothia aerolata]